RTAPARWGRVRCGHRALARTRPPLRAPRRRPADPRGRGVGRRTVDRDLGRRGRVGFDLDHGELAGGALGERGAGPVGGEHVRVAVTAEGRVAGVRVIPGAGGQLHDAGPNVLGERDPGQAAAAVVEDAHAGAVGDAACFRVAGVHRDRLAPADFAFLTVSAHVKLAVQPAARLVGYQLEPVPAGL